MNYFFVAHPEKGNGGIQITLGHISMNDKYCSMSQKQQWPDGIANVVHSVVHLLMSTCQVHEDSWW